MQRNETTNSQFNKLVETYEKFAEALREENPNVTISKEEQFAEALREENPNVTISKEEQFAEALREENPNVTIYQKLVTERLAFGFDSIYFRYAAVVDELARYKARFAANIGRLKLDMITSYDAGTLNFKPTCPMSNLRMRARCMASIFMSLKLERKLKILGARNE